MLPLRELNLCNQAPTNSGRLTPSLPWGLSTGVAVEATTSLQHTTKYIIHANTLICVVVPDATLFKVPVVLFYIACSCDELNHIFFLQFSELSRTCNDM